MTRRPHLYALLTGEPPEPIKSRQLAWQAHQQARVAATNAELAG